MLRLNVCCSLTPSSGQIKLGCCHKSWLINYHRTKKPIARVWVKAVKDEPDGGASRFPGRSWDPGLEVEVPFEQRPVNEYSSLKDGLLYSWGELAPGPLFLRLGGLWLVAFTVLGLPIAAASFNPSREPLRFVLSAGTGTLFLVSLIILRIYLEHKFTKKLAVSAKTVAFVNYLQSLIATSNFGSHIGWSYVGDRLLSAVIPYEESGWYDGQMWVKPPEVLARDRLLGSYKVKPVIKMLKQTLVGTGVLLVSAVLLFIFATPVEDFFKTTFSNEENPSNELVSKTNQKYNVRKEELVRLPAEVITDDDLAEAAAKAADGRPAYCRDRFYRALAGGQYCKWEDLVD